VKDFALGDVLSITTDCLVSRDHIDGVYRILNYMTGDNLFTHQLPRAAGECKPALLAQHPQLADVEVPEEFGGKEHVYSWLAEQEAIYGVTLPVEPLAAEDHTRIDPFSELRMKRPDMPIIAVEAESPRPQGDE
jgi:hypothetical protein